MTNQLKEKLLAYGTKAEPFTVHNHIRVTDLQDGEARVELTLQPESLNRWGTAVPPPVFRRFLPAADKFPLASFSRLWYKYGR